VGAGIEVYTKNPACMWAEREQKPTKKQSVGPGEDHKLLLQSALASGKGGGGTKRGAWVKNLPKSIHQNVNLVVEKTQEGKKAPLPRQKEKGSSLGLDWSSIGFVGGGGTYRRKKREKYCGQEVPRRRHLRSTNVDERWDGQSKVHAALLGGRQKERAD